MSISIDDSPKQGVNREFTKLSEFALPPIEVVVDALNPGPAGEQEDGTTVLKLGSEVEQG